MLADRDMERVEDAIRTVAAAEILPRFRNLTEADVRAKAHARDLVTLADTEAERRLGAALRAILPGSVVVGEEASEDDPSLPEALAGEAPVWVIDPVDGTLNFAEGRERFCVIVGLCRGGETLAGWIFEPVTDVLAVTAAGSGAWIGNERLRISEAPPVEHMTASLGPGLGRRMADRRLRGEDAPGRIIRGGCTGLDWRDMAWSRLHAAHYGHRLKPWDHAAGVRMHAEAGGHSALLASNAPYRPEGGILKDGILAAPDQAAWRELRRILEI